MSFLDRFFSEGNQLRWKAQDGSSSSPSVQKALEPFIALLESRAEFAILPRVRPNGETLYYALCRTPAAHRMAQDLVRAFIGRSHSRFGERPLPLDSSDPIEQAVEAEFGPHSFALAIPPDKKNVARERLMALVRLLLERPSRPERAPRATGRILRDFEFALQERNGDAARESIDELRANHRLSAQNLAFLEIRRSVAVGDFDAALEPVRLSEVLQSGMPRRVVEALLDAVYAQELARFEPGAQAAEATEHFRNSLRPRYEPILRTRAGLRGHAVAAIFLMDAVTSTPASQERVNALLELVPRDDTRRTYLESVAALLHPSPTQPAAKSLEEALRAYDAGDVDTAFERACGLSPGFQRTLLLVRCAREMEVLESVRVALESIEALPSGERERFHTEKAPARAVAALREMLLSAVDEEAPAPPPAGASAEPRTEAVALAPEPQPPPPAAPVSLPHGWLEWMERLRTAQPWPGAVRAAELGEREWSVMGLVADPPTVEKATTLIEANRDTWGQQAFRDALPHLIGALAEVPMNTAGGRAALRPLFHALFLQMATDQELSHVQWTAMARIFGLLMDMGMARAEYDEAMNCLVDGVRTLRARHLVEPALDLLEFHLDTPGPSRKGLRTFANSVHSLLAALHGRVAPEVRRAFVMTCVALGFADLKLGLPAEALGEERTVDLRKVLSGLQVALYSLRQSALNRAREALLEACDNVKVQCFSDAVGGSSQLTAAARNADLFVIATAAAKHAATTYIESTRPANKVTVLVHAQGSASLLKAVRDNAEKARANI
ncbi:protein DpdD [Corallococcus sp. bb12-1]|uniref:protein DpdD n=1 Tax=Corallococcus sp. bb12-1 TaxID=2996784 RepID=UPI00226F2101|nr:protein DpdD [Corallococcus sp. bb12-1]